MRLDARQGIDDLRAEPAKLLMVRRGQPLDQLIPLWRQAQENLPPVIRRDLPHHRGSCNQLVHDAHRAVMPHLHLLRQIADGKFSVRGRCSDREQRLVLIRRQILGAQQVFAETEELANLISKRGERLEFRGVQGTYDYLEPY